MTDEATPTPRRKLPPFHLVVVAVVVAAVGVGWAVGKLRTNRPAPDGDAPGLVAAAGRGEVLFQVHCASCHGPAGHGDGDGAAALRPPPRDFAARPWRTAVTPESIRRVIRDGIPGTAMPASGAALTPADLDALTDHVHRLATSRPLVAAEPSAEERLLRDARFVDLRGTDPPPLIGSDAQGGVVKLSDLKGRLVLLHFWSTTCTDCLKEMPQLRQLETEWAGRGLTVLHVCTDADDAKAARDLADRFAPGVRVVVDGAGLGMARFEVQLLPTVWLIDLAGKAIGRSHGARDWQSPTQRRLIEHWLPH